MSSSNRAGTRRIFRRLLAAVVGARAASTVEYAVILVAVLLLAAGSWKLLGGALGKRSNVAGDAVSGGSGSSSSGGGGSGSGGGKGQGSGGGGEKATAASKVTVGGVGGAAGESGGGAGSSRDTSSEPGSSGGGPMGSVGGRDTGGSDVTEGFTAKRWFGIGLLAAGVFALGYVVMSMRRAKKNADDMSKDGEGKKGMTAPRGPAPPLA